MILAPLLVLLAQSADAPAFEHLPVLPEARTSFGAARLHDRVWIYGGHAGAPHQYSQASVRGDLLSVGADDFGPPSAAASDAAWTPHPGGRPLQGACLVAHGGALIRVGGMVPLNAPGAKRRMASVDDCARFDPATESWTALPPLPAPRSSCDAAVVGSRLFVVGGWTLSPEGPPAWLDDVAVLDLEDPGAGWTAHPMPAPRRGVAAVTDGRRVAVVGGLDPEGDVSRRVDVFDPATAAWTRADDYPGFAFGAAGARLGERAYVMGFDGGLHRLDLAAGTWERTGTLLFPRMFGRLVDLPDGRLMALGGRGETGAVSACEVLDPEDARPEAPPPVFTVRHEDMARNRQGALLLGDFLHLAGGNLTPRQHDFDPESFSDRALRVHLPSMQVERITDLPAPGQSFQAAIAPGTHAADAAFDVEIEYLEPSAYLIGGFAHDGEAERSQDRIWRYEPFGLRWEAIEARLPRPRTQFAMIPDGEALWFFGGLDYDPLREEDFRYPLEVLRWTPRTQDAGPQPTGLHLPGPRRAFGAARLGDRVYLVGGMKEEFRLVDGVDVLHLRDRRWEQAPAPSKPRLSPQLFAWNDGLLLVGGSSPVEGDDDFAANATIERFDPESGTWSVLAEDLPMPIRHTHWFLHRDRLIWFHAQTLDGAARIGWLDLPALAAQAGGADEARS